MTRVHSQPWLMLFPLVVHCCAKAVYGLVVKSINAKLIATPNQVFLFAFCDFIFLPLSE